MYIYNIGLYFNSLKLFSLGRGYYPEPSKSVLIIHPDNPEAGNILACVTVLGFARSRVILVVLLGITNWLDDRMSKWEKNIRTITEMVGGYP